MNFKDLSKEELRGDMIMKLQTAIDRVTLSKAEEMVKIFAGKQIL